MRRTRFPLHRQAAFMTQKCTDAAVSPQGMLPCERADHVGDEGLFRALGFRYRLKAGSTMPVVARPGEP